ncbi:MAG TPA: response regulator [bacterium]|nr:response regulator [bacterium]
MENKRKVVLIIEDETPLLDSYSEILSSAGFDTLGASDGYKGMKVLSENKDSVDLVLLDLMMPGIDGLEVLRNFASKLGVYGEKPVIVLTAMVSDQVIKEAYELGAKSYLIKSELNSDELVNEIKRVLSS